ncbi:MULTISPECIES: Mo-dependent nitrogenase C-terminal domain-containing protein [Nostocales]|uniref:Nitrogenase n=3 Tax=Nostocales TaxID=1161 RepID=A0A8S9TG75_9CYAN|nr:Mo-dependent nitrogenase C-terminal domain-containing protein [Tolypothrix bouteillei]KAF3890449.1 nitrogenase [Tolypothrix bouteillei VB521301]
MLLNNSRHFGFHPIQSIRQWLDSIEINDCKVAQRLCKTIPAQCPFERKLTLFNRTILYIPPLCKLNPFYEQLVMLRFKSLVYLADVCGEDVTVYC